MDLNQLEERLSRIDRADRAEVDAVRALLLRWEGDNPLPLGAAVRDEAGKIDVADVIEMALQPGDGIALHPGDGIAVQPGLQPGDGVIGRALLEEAGEIDIAGGVLAAIAGTLPVRDAVRTELAGTVPVADAVRAEAGEVDVVDDVMLTVGASDAWLSALLDRELSADAHGKAAARLAAEPDAGVRMTALADVGRAVRAAVTAEAGHAPELWHGVALSIGISDPEAVPGYVDGTVADAVRAEAGTVDVTAAVLARVQRVRTAEGAEPAVPVPASGRWSQAANRPFAWGAMALVAAVFMAVIGANVLSGVTRGGQAEDRATPVAQLDFASPDEITIEDMEYGEDAFVQVITTEGDDAATIIWVDGELL